MRSTITHATKIHVRPRWRHGFLAAAIGITGMSIGCSIIRPDTPATPPPKQTQVESPASIPPEPAVDGPDADRLAAIEDFLSRTQQYRLGAPADRTTAPSDAEAQVLALRTVAAKDAAPATSPTRPVGASAREAVANAQVDLGRGSVAPPQLAIPALQSVKIKASEPSSPTQTPDREVLTNVPVPTPSGQGGVTWDELIEHLEAEAQQHNDLPHEWALRLVQLAASRDGDALALSTNLNQETRALMATLLETAIGVRNLARNPLLTGDAVLEHVDALRNALSDRADLRIEAVALCRKVLTFGVYDEMDESDFVAGKTLQTIVYSQIDNFRPQRAEDGQYETRLGTRLDLINAAGESVWTHEEPEIVDRCRRRRGDFFIAQRITLPPTLPVGEYTLKLSVEDKGAGRMAETNRPMKLLAPVSVAKRPTPVTP
ncbi:MAG: hypothetical protein AABZ12_07235 [Planctomycetota bacterium]